MTFTLRLTPHQLIELKRVVDRRARDLVMIAVTHSAGYDIEVETLEELKHALNRVEVEQ